MPGVLPGGCHVLVSDRRDGDLRGPGAAGARRRLVDRPWVVPDQVHGAGVVVLDASEAGTGTAVQGDAVVTTSTSPAVAVLGADCALVALASPEGVIAVAHAGWRGLLAGILEETVQVMTGIGASRIEAVLGPCIHPECYAFGPDELALVASRLGPSVRSTTSGGEPALDLPAGVAAALGSVGVAPPAALGGCTACDERWFSHRARAEADRHALVAWRGEP